jgi:hypothetical protein
MAAGARLDSLCGLSLVVTLGTDCETYLHVVPLQLAQALLALYTTQHRPMQEGGLEEQRFLLEDSFRAEGTVIWRMRSVHRCRERHCHRISDASTVYTSKLSIGQAI